jgi:hypothetical protein
MPLTADQLTTAKATLADRLDPLKSEGARVTLSPIMQGPLSKGEFQIFYEGSGYSAPTLETYNRAYSQIRTLRWRAFIELKDLRDPWAALPILEQSKTLLQGLQLFGPHPEAPYEGGIYSNGDQFTQDRKDASRWIYQLNLQCAIIQFLAEPSS